MPRLHTITLLAATLVPLLHGSVRARPVDAPDHVPLLQMIGPAGADRSPRGALAGVFGAAQAETTYYGGTYWAADSARWEALEDSVWTFDSGVGSHFDHGAPGVDPHKDPALHAYMEGWVGWDRTYSSVTYFRRLGASDPRWGPDVCVGSEAGIPPGPGDAGNAFSFWCGVFPEEAGALCYAEGQGYGTSWNVCIQKLYAHPGGTVTLDFDYVNDTEPGFDFSRVVVDTAASGLPEHEVPVVQYDGTHGGHEALTLEPGIELPAEPGNIYLKFCFESDPAYDDEDGFFPTTCGAFAVDNIALSGAISDGPATFETGEDGWELAPSRGGTGGDWSHLVHVDDLPPTITPCDCALQDSVLVFDDVSMGGGHNPFQDNLAVSPWIDLGPAGYDNRAPGKILETGFYAVLPLLNYVFMQNMVQWYPVTCPATGKLVTSPWTSTGFFFFFGGVPTCPAPGEPGERFDYSSIIPVGAEQIRVAVGVATLCRFFANCTGITNSTPWYEDVRLGVYGVPDAPIISVRSTDLPQDSFPADGTLAWNAAGRIDCNEVLGQPSPEPGTSLGDTLLVRGVGDNAEVFVQFTIHPGAGVDSTALLDFLGSVTFEETRVARDWYSARMDTAENEAGPATGVWMTARIEGSPGFTGSDRDRDPLDLDVHGRQTRLVNDLFPDDLLTPGSRLTLFYKTRYVGGTAWFVLPDTTGGNYIDMDVMPSSFSDAQEFNCVLYVDHFDGLGAEPLIRDALREILGAGGGTFEEDPFDTYNVRAPSSRQASLGRPGYAAGQIMQTAYGASVGQILGYRTILWNSGTLASANLTREDADILIPWLTLHEYDYNNLYLSGDGLVQSAIDEAAFEPSARRLVEDLAGVTLTCRTYRDRDCPPGKPLDGTACVNLDPVAGARVGGNLGRTVPQVGRGNGCPEQQSFDVLGTSPSPENGVAAGDEIYSTAAATSGPDGFASVSMDAADGGPLHYRIVTDGLSIHHRRGAADCSMGGDATAVSERLAEVLTYLGYAEPEICQDRIVGGPPPPPPTPPPVTALANFAPNPFRPGAPGRIRFTLEQRGPVRLDIFDLSGRRVRTLEDRLAEAGPNEAFWDGTDGTGRPVAGGVYFYRLRALGEDYTKKVVVIRR